jgi:hypothetical protein
MQSSPPGSWYSNRPRRARRDSSGGGRYFLSGNETASHFHLRHCGGTMVAFDAWHTPGKQLLRAKCRQHHEFVRVHMDRTIHHSSPLPLSGQAMVRNPQNTGTQNSCITVSRRRARSHRGNREHGFQHGATERTEDARRLTVRQTRPRRAGPSGRRGPL